MLAQLPPHTISKKVENYEHLDLLWGKDVDKVVFPHVLEFLDLYARSVEGSKALEAKSSHNNTSSPPAYSANHSAERRKRSDTAGREPGASYAQATGGDRSRSDRPARSSCAKIVADPSEADRSGESDSDETMGNDHATVNPNVSYANVAEAGALNDE